MKYKCSICGFVYDESIGYPQKNIAPNTPFDSLPSEWVCPLCGAEKSMFNLVVEDKNKENNAEIEVIASAKQKDKKFESIKNSVEFYDDQQLAVILSNLKRGAEKQYLDKEAALFGEIQNFFENRVEVGEHSLEELTELLKNDLAYYAELHNVADKNLDRGAKRAVVWSEKVTKILEGTLKKYLSEGANAFENKNVYVCDICGFIYVGDTCPDVCPVCKVPSLKILKVERRA